MQALLVLPGLGGGARARARMRAWGADQPFAVHVPDYHRRAGLDATLGALGEYIAEHRLDRIHDLGAFCFVLGSWTLNRYLADHHLPGLRAVVYDRSPYQERLAAAFDARFALIGRIRYGRLLHDFVRTPYPPLPVTHPRVGLLIEDRPTRMARRLLPGNAPSLDPDMLGQPHDDATQVPFDHDAMYTHFAEVAPQVLRFIRHGRFSP